MSSFTRPYARAFLEAAPPGYDVAAFLEAGQNMANAFEANPALRAFLLAPNVPREAKSKAIAAIAARVGLDDYGARFLQVMLRNHRLLAAADVFKTLRDLNDQRQNVLRVQLTVPAPLTDAERKTVEDAIAARTGKTVTIADRNRLHAARGIHRPGRIPRVRRIGGRRDPAVPDASQ